MKRKETFINDKRRVSYLAAIYNRIYRGQSVLIEGDYGVGKSRFLNLIQPQKLRGVRVETLFNIHELLASILQELNYDAKATYRRTPRHLKQICSLSGFSKRSAYLAAIYNRIYRGQSVLIEGDYGVGKSRFLNLIQPQKLRGVRVETLFNIHELLASILRIMTRKPPTEGHRVI